MEQLFQGMFAGGVAGPPSCMSGRRRKHDERSQTLHREGPKGERGHQAVSVQQDERMAEQTGENGGNGQGRRERRLQTVHGKSRK